MSNLTDAIIAAKLVGGSGGSGGGSGLPEVTADDNGDVLTVVEGAWGKAAPIGGGGLYIIELKTQPSSSYANLPSGVTYANILAALSEGKLPILHIKTGTSSSNGVHYWIPLSEAKPYSGNLVFVQWVLIETPDATTGVNQKVYTILSTNKINVRSFTIKFAS